MPPVGSSPNGLLHNPLGRLILSETKEDSAEAIAGVAVPSAGCPIATGVADACPTLAVRAGCPTATGVDTGYDVKPVAHPSDPDDGHVGC